MEKLLKIFSVVFFLFGFVLVALGTGLALAAGQLAFLLFAAVGFVFFLVGVGMMAAISRARRLRRWLEQNGRTIQADIIGVQYNPRVRLNGRCSFVLQCQAVNPADDLDQQDLPDIVSQRLTDLDRRLSQLEKAAQGDIPPTAAQIAARQRK